MSFSLNLYHFIAGSAAIRAARLTEEDRVRISKQKNDTRPLKLKILDFPKAIFILVSIRIRAEKYCTISAIFHAGGV